MNEEVNDVMMRAHAPEAVDLTDLEFLDAADSADGAERRIAEAMRTGNRILVARVRAEVGR